MPKMKTKSGAKKRFKVTGSGRIKHRRAAKRHLLEHKSSKRTRQLRGSVVVDETHLRQVKRMLLL